MRVCSGWYLLPTGAKRNDMAKKTFVQSARVVESTKKWYIEYQVWHESTGLVTRHRKDFQLNDIENELIRREVAKILCTHLKNFVGLDDEVATSSDQVDLLSTTMDCVQDALEKKLLSPRKNTHKSYITISTAFCTWLKDNKLSDMPITSFSRKYAQAYWDELRRTKKNGKKYKGRTLNNYLISLRALWGEMLSREIVTDNPWSAIKMAMEEEKERRPFTDQEKRIVAGYIQKNDYWLFRALLLQYFCFIRPVEISRLKFKAFDFVAGTVKVEAYEAKKWKSRYATIPKSVLCFFTDGIFDKQPLHFYIYGLTNRGVIGPSVTPARETRQYKRHKKVLDFLKDSGALLDITGLTWYSWKDTGISHHAHATSPLSTRDQAGHSDFDMTLTYYRQEKVNQEYMNLENDLLTPGT